MTTRKKDSEEFKLDRHGQALANTLVKPHWPVGCFFEIVWVLITRAGMKLMAVIEYYQVVADFLPGFIPVFEHPAAGHRQDRPGYLALACGCFWRRIA